MMSPSSLIRQFAAMKRTAVCRIVNGQRVCVTISGPTTLTADDAFAALAGVDITELSVGPKSTGKFCYQSGFKSCKTIAIPGVFNPETGKHGNPVAAEVCTDVVKCR